MLDPTARARATWEPVPNLAMLVCSCVQSLKLTSKDQQGNETSGDSFAAILGAVPVVTLAREERSGGEGVDANNGKTSPGSKGGGGRGGGEAWHRSASCPGPPKEEGHNELHGSRKLL